MRIHRKRVFAVIISLLLQASPNAQAAPNVVFNGLLTGCGTVFSNSNIYAVRMRAYTTTTLSGININVGSGLNGNWSTTKYWVVSHNLSTGGPGVILETFTADSTSGSGANTLVHFSGSYTINTGTQFYLFPNVSFSTFPVCYSNSPPTANLFPNDGINIDTSTSLTNSNWNKAFVGGAWPGPNSNSWSLSANIAQIWQMSLESSAAIPATISLTISAPARSATYRTIKSISASVNTPSMVTFYQNGKKIAGCINIASVAGNSNCNWKASTRGVNILKATAKPISSSFLQATTSGVEVLVGSRSNTR